MNPAAIDRGAPPRLRVLSFNLRGALSADGWNIWPLRYPLVKGVLERTQPTVLAFQEMLAPNDWMLRPSLKAYDLVRGPVTGRRFIGPRNPLFFAREELVLEASGSFFLGTRPQTFRADWGARQVRGATWTRLRHRGRRLLFLNTHLDHESQRARTQSIQLILTRLCGLGWPAVPAVLCGDFNAGGDSSEHALMQKAGFRDAWTEAGHADAPTFHGFRGAAATGEQRIDWILHSSQLRTLRAELVRDAQPPRYPSDHYPVLAELGWSADGA